VTKKKKAGGVCGSLMWVRAVCVVSCVWKREEGARTSHGMNLVHRMGILHSALKSASSIGSMASTIVSAMIPFLPCLHSRREHFENFTYVLRVPSENVRPCSAGAH
jgi:hypothetical protein